MKKDATLLIKNSIKIKINLVQQTDSGIILKEKY